jgi:hypothetical protein
MTYRPVDTVVERSLGGPAPSRPTYSPIHLDDDVPVGLLVRALTRFGLTLSNVAGVGLVIHKAEQEPTCPSAS